MPLQFLLLQDGDYYANIYFAYKFAEVVELADALDSKSSGLYRPCGFNSHLRHHISIINGFRVFDPETIFVYTRETVKLKNLRNILKNSRGLACI